MTIKDKTARDVLDLLCKYLSQEDIRRLVRELLTVQGSKGFQDVIAALWVQVS